MILIPIKNLSGAKQRLASVLDQSARTELARGMLLDVLSALQSWSGRPDLALVTSDPFALGIAKEFGCEIISDNLNRSETDAIEVATQYCVSRGRDCTLVIPADVPLITAAELQAILDSAPAEGSVLVPAADGRGTNAVWRRPAGLFPLRFGNDSFKSHLAAAQAVQKSWVVLNLPGVALDVDNPEDLQRLAAASGETRSQRLARQWGFGKLSRATTVK